MTTADVISQMESVERQFAGSSNHDQAVSDEQGILLKIVQSIAMGQNKLVEATAMCSVFLKRKRFI